MKAQFEEIGDFLEGMDLRQISRYLEDLRFNLLCHEMADEVDQPVEGNGEAVHHYLTALSHIEIAKSSMNLAHIHNPKRRKS